MFWRNSVFGLVVSDTGTPRLAVTIGRSAPRGCGGKFPWRRNFTSYTNEMRGRLRAGFKQTMAAETAPARRQRPRGQSAAGEKGGGRNACSPITIRGGSSSRRCEQRSWPQTAMPQRVSSTASASRPSSAAAAGPLLFLHPGIGISSTAPVLDRLAERARVIAPSHPGFGGSEQPASFTSIDDLAYFYLDLIDALDLDRHHRGGRLARRLDRGRDGGEILRPHLASGARQPGGHQGLRSRDPRHRRHLRDDRRAIRRAGLFRSGRRQARLQGDAGGRGPRGGAQPGSDRALRLVALYARPQAQAAPAPHPGSHPPALGHRRPHSLAALWASLLRRHSGRAFRADRARRPFPPSREPDEFARRIVAFVDETA